MNPYLGWFLLGVTGSIWIKLTVYMRKLNPYRRTYLYALRKWFFDDTATGVTTISVIAFIWAVETVYVERVPVSGLRWLSDLQLTPAFALLIGSVSESAAGYFFKRLFNWIFPKG